MHAVGFGAFRICGARTGVHTPWKKYSHHAGVLHTFINTAGCNFERDKVQFAASVTASAFGNLTSAMPSHSIANISAQGFSVLAFHASLSSQALWTLAVNQKWQVSWVGARGQGTGATEAGIWKFSWLKPHCCDFLVFPHTQGALVGQTHTSVRCM
jgi:hypothetical protein